MNHVNAQSHAVHANQRSTTHSAQVPPPARCSSIKTEYEQLYLHDAAVWQADARAAARLLTLVGQALDTLEEWKLVVVGRQGRSGCDKASEAWRSAKVAKSLDKYLKWLFGSAPPDSRTTHSRGAASTGTRASCTTWSKTCNPQRNRHPRAGLGQ